MSPPQKSTMNWVHDYLANHINTGTFATSYTLDALRQRLETHRVVLPICSLGTPVETLTQLAPVVLPPLYHEAMHGSLKASLLSRIQDCFPYYLGTAARDSWQGVLEIIELPVTAHPVSGPTDIFAFSVDTAVEEHGPHLPLATDTLQSYGVLRLLQATDSRLTLGPPVEYGHLTWGLPFGMSIDITPQLLTAYVTGFANAVMAWTQAAALYVVDVHGSPVHRAAIEAGLEQSDVTRWAFRWLHEPLREFAALRGDQHAGGVETALMDHLHGNLVDRHIWPAQLEALTAGQMSFAEALDIGEDLDRFIRRVETSHLNGIVGKIDNFYDVDAELMLQRMLQVARDDLSAL